jgi:hypothetical protein
VILFGYLGLALVVGVTSALLIVATNRASDRARLFVRCLRWGFATGAATGAVFAASLPVIGSLRGDPGLPLGLMFGSAIYGAIIGAIVALIPTLIGAVFITDLLRQRHPHPASEASVQSDLTGVFAVVVAVLDVILLVALFVSGQALSSAAIALPLIVLGNACVVLMLWRARTSISRLWLEVAVR